MAKRPSGTQNAPPLLARFETAPNPPDSVALHLFGDDATEYTVSIPRSLITRLIFEFVRQSERLPALGQKVETFPLTPLGVNAAFGPDGQRGISIRLAGGLRLTLTLTDQAIADFQVELTKLAQTKSPTRRPTSH
jgi:hypothetical protein